MLYDVTKKEEAVMNQKCVIFKSWIRNIVSYQYYEKLRFEKDQNIFRKKLSDMNWNILPSFENYVCHDIQPFNSDIKAYEKVNEMLEIISIDCDEDFISYFKKFCNVNAHNQFFDISDEKMIPKEILNIIKYITIPDYFNKSETERNYSNDSKPNKQLSTSEFFEFKDKCKQLSETYIKSNISNPIKKKKYLNEIDIIFKDNKAINRLLKERVISPDNIKAQVFIDLISDFSEDPFEEKIAPTTIDLNDNFEFEEEIEEPKVKIEEPLLHVEVDQEITSKIKIPIYEVNAENIHDAIRCMLHYYDGLFISFIKNHLKTSLSDKAIYKFIHTGAELGYYKKVKSKDHLYQGQPVDQFFKSEEKRKYYFYNGKNYKIKDLCDSNNFSQQTFYRRIKTMNHIQALETSVNEKMARSMQE